MCLESDLKYLLISIVVISALFCQRIHGLNNSSVIQLYRYKLDIGNPNVLCPPEDYCTCSNGQTTYLCDFDIKPKCRNFKEIILENKHMKHFVETHNGIRNKIAMDYQIANMNLLYWSSELAAMASKYILLCRVQKDPCQYIGEKALFVSQNFLTLKDTKKKSWPGRAVRRWYVEIGVNSQSFDQYWIKKDAMEHQNFSNLIFPSTEFIGCAAGSMHGRVMVTCYYYPAFNESTALDNFKLGLPCSLCSRSRPTCSLDFDKLCGVDVEMEGAMNVKRSNYIMYGALLFNALWAQVVK